MRLDSHQHFWSYSEREYDWIDERMSRIRRDFAPSDLEPILRRNGFDGSIAVQVRQNPEETEYLLGLADEHETDLLDRRLAGQVRARLLEQELRHALQRQTRGAGPERGHRDAARAAPRRALEMSAQRGPQRLLERVRPAAQRERGVGGVDHRVRPLERHVAGAERDPSLHRFLPARSTSPAASSGTRISCWPTIEIPRPPSRVGRSTTFTVGR